MYGTFLRASLRYWIHTGNVESAKSRSRDDRLEQNEPGKNILTRTAKEVEGLFCRQKTQQTQPRNVPRKGF